MTSINSSPFLDQYTLRESAEDNVQALMNLISEARKTRRKLEGEGLCANNIATESNLTADRRNTLYLLVRPLVLLFSFELIFAKYCKGEYELICEIDLATLESQLFLLFLRRVELYNGTQRKKPVKFTTYLFACLQKAHLRCIEYARKINREESKLLQCPEILADHPDPKTSEHDDIIYWPFAKACLSRRQYYILWSHLVEGQTVATIAEKYNLTVGRIKELKLRALRRVLYFWEEAEQKKS